MPKLSKTQQEVYDRMVPTVIYSAYTLRATMATMYALVRTGYAKDVTPFGAGGMFSPTTHYKFIKVDKA